MPEVGKRLGRSFAVLWAFLAAPVTAVAADSVQTCKVAAVVGSRDVFISGLPDELTALEVCSGAGHKCRLVPAAKGAAFWEDVDLAGRVVRVRAPSDAKATLDCAILAPPASASPVTAIVTPAISGALTLSAALLGMLFQQRFQRQQERSLRKNRWVADCLNKIDAFLGGRSDDFCPSGVPDIDLEGLKEVLALRDRMMVVWSEAMLGGSEKAKREAAQKMKSVLFEGVQRA